ncbi:hypothetical protein KAI58_03575 [Candidatus Gracilibacteria bacterium]|nr:hypothetical protein [Candidatus Gracilibacteria bacterium]
MNKKILVIGFVVVVVFVVIGLYGDKVILNREIRDNSISNGSEGLISPVVDISTDLPKKEFQSKKVSGRIKEINGQKLILRIEPSSLDSSELNERIVEVNESTKIYRLVLKDQEKMHEELENYSKNIKDATSESENKLLAMPDMFVKQEINLQDIKVGEQVTIVAENDIYMEKQFFAMEIFIEYVLE